jgi:adhesin/invasin
MKFFRYALIWSQAMFQALLPMCSTAQITHTAEDIYSQSSVKSSFSNDWPNAYRSDDSSDSLPFSGPLSQGARILASHHTSDSARALAVRSTSAEIQQWLNQFGTAHIQLNVDRYGNWGQSRGDLLIPIYDNQHYLLFVQGGVGKPSDRLTGNLGFGVRTFLQNGWMAGGNIFFDEDFTGYNRRVGFGGEAWRDYLRLSANIYQGTTDWHTSRDFDGAWQEKSADGYDFRAQGWLPTYPQLGAKLVWEQYYGQQVALFGKDYLQHNPYAVTAGVEYTPVPLVTLGADHKQGHDEHDTQFSLGLHWQFGHDWHWQLAPINVQSMRSLAGSRYDQVDRNNEIVLQYRKNSIRNIAYLTLTLVTDNSPADGLTRNVLQVLATNDDGQPVRSAPVSWNVPSDGSTMLTAASAITDDSGLATATLTSTKVQTIAVTAQSGSISASQSSHFMAVAVSNIALEVTQDHAVADGNSADVVIATLTDNNGRPVAGQKVTWTLPEGVILHESSSTSDTDGKATVHLASTASGRVNIRASAGTQSANVPVQFIGNAASAKVESLVVTSNGSPADSKTPNQAQVTVTDTNGNPLPGQNVFWKSDKPTVHFGKSTVTDSVGRTTISYTDSTAESLLLTATLANGNDTTASSLFVPDRNSARLRNLDVTSGAKASGTDTNTATVTVTDANGNALSNTVVTFSVTGSAKLNTTSKTTDNDGKAQVILTNTQAETVQVTATLASGSSMTSESSFVTDLDSVQLSLTTTTGILADGNATGTAIVVIKDKIGHPLSGQPVALTTTGSVKLSVASGTTNGNGQMVVTLTDTTAETVTITASLSNGKQSTAQATFIGFSVTALTSSAASVKANGTDTATLTATVEDNNGNPVANNPVTFSVNGSSELSATSVMTNISGQAQVTVTDDTGEDVTITAKAKKNRSDGGKTTTVKFIASAITGLTVNNTGAGYQRVFTADSGFPETGYTRAAFTLNIDNGTVPVANYTWKSSQGWVSVTDGVVTFSGTPSTTTKAVTITATPKTGKGTLSWSFTLAHWFTFSSGTMSATDADNYCAGLGQSMPSKDLLDYTDYGDTKVGSLWSEWSNTIPSPPNTGVWANEVGRYTRYYMLINNGHVYDNAGNHQFGAACENSL